MKQSPSAKVMRGHHIPYPTFPGSDAVATHSEGVYPVAPVVVSEALIGSWSA
jgi:hypothetical protein